MSKKQQVRALAAFQLLAIALVDAGHKWSPKQRRAYETGRAILARGLSNGQETR